MSYQRAEQGEIEKALFFLAKSFEESGHNEKPVLLHSIRVAMDLYNQDSAVDIVVGAILHDILEDTDVTEKQLELNFGEKISKIVKALSFDKSIVGYEEQYQENFARLIEYGNDALIIRAVDILDNSAYYNLGDDNTQNKPFGKLKYFLHISEPYISANVFWQKVKSFSDLWNN